jgi:hypothetical protein
MRAQAARDRDTTSPGQELTASWVGPVAMLVAITAGSLLGVVAYPVWRWVALFSVGVVWLWWMAARWRAATFALTFAMPFVAIPGLVLGATGWPTLLKDVLFVVPAYVGLAMNFDRHRMPLHSRPIAVGLIVLTAVLVVYAVQSALSHGVLVAAVGLKTWLFYVPLLVLPGQMFRSPRQLERWLHGFVLIAIIPSAIGIAQAVLIYSGREEWVWAMYGPLASSVTQDFAGVGVSDDSSVWVRRVPSTFSFVTQYYLYLISTFPLAVAVWLGARERRWRRIGGLATLLVGLAGVLSGARSFLAWMPFELALMFVLSGGRGRLKVLAIVAAACGVGGLAFGGEFFALSQGVLLLIGEYLGPVAWWQFDLAISSAGWWGVGVGSQTNATRYILGEGAAVGVGIEAGYAKILYEVGLPGLLATLMLWVVILVGMWRARGAVFSPQWRALSTALLVVLITAMANLWKGSLLDIDPLNVYFWFYIGVAVALPRIEGRVHRQGVEG